MRSTFDRWSLRLIALALISVASSAQAQQTKVCIPLSSPDSLGYYLLSKVKAYTSPVDSTYEHDGPLLGIPLLLGQLTLETQEATCKKLAAAYKAKLGALGSQVSGRVYAVPVGLAHIVLDPNFMPNPDAGFTHMSIDNRSYTVIAVFR